MQLGKKMIPPNTSYTQSGDGNSNNGDPKDGNVVEPVNTDVDEGGRPSKEDGEKADTTLKKEQSLN